MVYGAWIAAFMVMPRFGILYDAALSVVVAELSFLHRMSLTELGMFLMFSMLNYIDSCI
jgi:hypothetical protein